MALLLCWQNSVLGQDDGSGSGDAAEVEASGDAAASEGSGDADGSGAAGGEEEECEEVSVDGSGIKTG